MRGTFHCLFDLMPADNLETGQTMQISWWIFIWPGVHFVPCLVLCQQWVLHCVDPTKAGHMVGNASSQSRESHLHSFSDEAVKGALLTYAETLCLDAFKINYLLVNESRVLGKVIDLHSDITRSRFCIFCLWE